LISIPVTFDFPVLASNSELGSTGYGMVTGPYCNGYNTERKARGRHGRASEVVTRGNVLGIPEVTELAGKAGVEGRMFDGWEEPSRTFQNVSIHWRLQGPRGLWPGCGGGGSADLPLREPASIYWRLQGPRGPWPRCGSGGTACPGPL
jgi:hypothetical protein